MMEQEQEQQPFPVTAAAQLLGLSQLGPDAREDSHAAAYALLVVAPLCALASRLLLARGKATTYQQVLLVALAVPALLISVPVWLKWRHGEWNIYRLLNMQRTETRYVWSQKYAFLRNLYQKGEMPANVWHEVDAAYDQIYDDARRMAYDFWGPAGAAMSLVESQLNVALFYVLWATILFVLTTPTRSRDASKWVFTGLLVLLCFELAVKLMHYDPPLRALFPTTTPREFVVWGHRMFPIFAFAAVGVKHVFYVDMDKHRKLQLQHMLEQNEVAKRELLELERRLLQPDGEDNGSASEDAATTTTTTTQ